MLRLWLVSCFLLVTPAVTLVGQTVPTAKADLGGNDYSREAFVIEQFTRKLKFEQDGSSSREDSERIRIQSEAGVQRFGLLTFSYPSATGTFAVTYIKVHKPDGSVVETPPENVQDMASEITRQAPFYSDLREKHVAVRGLGVGDTLEFRIEEHTTKPLVPGQFWAEYQFSREEIVLDEHLEITVPRVRQIKIKSDSMAPEVSEAGGYRVYSFHFANLHPKKDDANDKRKLTEKMWEQLRGRLPRPDVLISSFASWQEVGGWYGGLQDERVKPTPEVSAKAAELTKNLPTDEAKIKALYAYVSTQFRYIGVSFGIGRYQPHGASDVLSNQYGDCKDKHTLLASLLTAVGIPAYPALISTAHEIDEEVPSPGQFDHVITAVPRETGLIWLDTTTEVGPYQFLLSPLREKHALVIWKDKPAALLTTPADLPYPATQQFKMDAKLNEEGTLEGQTDLSVRGDLEVLLRGAFRQTSVSQWQDLAHRVSLGSGFGGEVSEVTASSPEKTDEPFHLAYKYTRKEFADWPNRRILAPSPLVLLNAPGDDELLPIGPSWLGSLLDIQVHTSVELPPTYRPVIPPDVHLKRDFAQFDVTYSFKDGKLISDRHLKTLLREVPASEREDFRQLTKAIQDDYGTFITLSSSQNEAAGSLGKNPTETAAEEFQDLPDSGSQEASRLAKEAADEFRNHDLPSAVSSLYRAVAEDPKFTRAWIMLGQALFGQHQTDGALNAFQKAISLNPDKPAISMALALGFMQASQFEEAAELLQDYVKAHPDDADAGAALGKCYFRLKRFADAAAAYEAAAKDHSDRADLLVGAASAYREAGNRQKASTAYGKLADVNAGESVLNTAAYEMANADLQLPLALSYSKKAVTAAEESSQKISLPNLTMEDLNDIFSVAANWDTFGWVNERMSNMDVAEQYLLASWKLTQDGVVAGHLCHLYRRTHRIPAAIQMCRVALNRIPMSVGLRPDEAAIEMDSAKQNLDQMAPGWARKTTLDTADAVIRERTFRMTRFLTGTESAEFFVLLASDGKGKTFKVDDVKFVSGSDKMKSQGKQLKTVLFNFPSPGNTPIRFVRRGILGCYQYTGCSFVLLDPAAVHSLQ